MALHLVDTNNADRSAPTPNKNDQLIADSVKAHSTASSQYNTDATTQTGYLQQRNTQFIANDGTDPRALFGYNSALNDWGFYVTQSGVDVTTNADLSKFIFNSQQDVFKIVKKIQTNIPQFSLATSGSILSGWDILTVAHGQSFTPTVEVFVQGKLLNFNNGSLIAASYVPLPIYQVSVVNMYWFPNVGNTTNYPLSILFGVDATNVYIQAAYSANGSGSDTVASIPVTIFVRQETTT
jgi:hypothetical protein